MWTGEYDSEGLKLAEFAYERDGDALVVSSKNFAGKKNDDGSVLRMSLRCEQEPRK